MAKSPLYPDCDFAIWFRSVNENNVTGEPIEGKKTGKNEDVVSDDDDDFLLRKQKELFPNGSMDVSIKMGPVYLMLAVNVFNIYSMHFHLYKSN
jgi:hypothetical protein